MKKILSICIMIAVAGCGNTKDNAAMKTDYSKPLTQTLDKQGHRGCRGLMPENTIPAMLEAKKSGVTTLEMDVVISKDGQVVLSHEPFFNHEITTKPDGSFISVEKEKEYNLYKMTYEEIAKYDVGSKPHPRFPDQEKMKVAKPLLSDVFLAIVNMYSNARGTNTYYNIETKTQPETDGIFHPSPEEFVDKLMDVIKKSGQIDFVTIQSFDFRTLQYLHKKYPAAKTAMLIDVGDKRSMRKQLDDLGFTPTIYSPEQSLVNPVLIKACHEKGIQIIPWTVNEVADMKRLVKMGVDGLISDYPTKYAEL